ncbi:rho GTPase-activating protein 7 isoform X1 [Tachyglossus aculeatus]|uniref:rho GTPase-activating protein 7 isoform X1 n=1 Tax=Tachyglossus aculeatus TaxID=9261 RepID=UPI0018F623C8|nr:rho GTPase-activating protein 7 isoform X1 [Tachyglossus aculeatus]XP_038625171.1 rho GTPase-activating protein 7 isoform X1 [Tachyglossus aculeatus]
MSLAVRKRSWEEHVTQGMGPPFNPDDYAASCHHGLVADRALVAMDRDGAPRVDCRERCSSLPDRPRRGPKGVERHQDLGGRDQAGGLEASTETLVHVSDGEDGSEPGLDVGVSSVEEVGAALEVNGAALPGNPEAPRTRPDMKTGCRAVEAPRASLGGLPPAPTDTGTSPGNGLDESGFLDGQAAPPEGLVAEVGEGEGRLGLEPAHVPVRLRKRKESGREDHHRSRLDSMVLLIMKLDQLDQDIESALSASSSSPPGSSPPGTSPLSTPTCPRRHTPAAPVVSEKEKSEIEAKEACDWLRATGFPQYAQLYEDLLFPVDIALVKREHDFLDRDAIEALCRRLNTLNKCAVMKLEISRHRKRSEDSDEDEPCAISGRWTFQRDSKRWSRLDELDAFAAAGTPPGPPGDPKNTAGGPGEQQGGPAPGPDRPSPRGSGAKAGEKSAKSKTRGFLKRMESLKARGGPAAKAKVPPGPGLLISGPVLCEGAERLQRLRCVEIAALPGSRERSVSGGGCPSEAVSEAGTPSPLARTRSLSACSKRAGMYLEGFDPFNQSTFPGILRQNSGDPHRDPADPVFYVPEDHKPGTFPKALSNGRPEATGPGPGDGRPRRHGSAGSTGSRLSVYDNVPGLAGDLGAGDPGADEVFPELDDVLSHVRGLQRAVNQWSEKLSDEGDSDSALDSVSPCPSSPQQTRPDRDGRRTPSDLDSTGTSLLEPEEPADPRERRDSGVGASLTRCDRHRLRWSSFHSSHRPSPGSAGLQIGCQSVAQMNLLQKYSLLKLTALLEKYTPSNKHGFSWAVPKFMKRMKVPDYKERSVFGVPLPVNVQRTGQPLPQSIQQAMRYLRSQCLDQVGLFRKSGVKSRIQALRQMNDGPAGGVSYEGQSAYDVADMLKQYFRDLPEPLMTNKLSETFLQIYQYVPKDQRLPAIQAAIMLLPDENREALQTLLYFLSDVTAAVKENQMTPTNLAVCLAPSLFHLNTLKRENSSPRVMQRKQSLGKPDQKDLNENLAATQGLAHMIAECKKLFQVPEEMSRCRNSYTEQELGPLSLEALGRLSREEDGDYRHFLQDCVDSLFKEVKDKFRGWVSCSTAEPAELSYKKVSEGPPLRLWRSSVEVPAGPEAVLNRLLKEQRLWDVDLLDARVIETLDSHTDIYQFVQSSMAPHPARDFVVLRTWRTNLPKGACALLLTSVDHGRAPEAGVRVNVLMSRYLIEPCGSGKSKLTYMCRTDLRGHMPEWYTKAFGHLCAAEVVKIRDSFGPRHLEAKDAKAR